MCDGCYALCVERPVCASNEWTRMNSLSKAAVDSGLGAGVLCRTTPRVQGFQHSKQAVGQAADDVSRLQSVAWSLSP